MEPNHCVSSQSVELTLDPLLVDPLEEELRFLISLQNDIIIGLVESHQEVRDEIIIVLAKQKMIQKDVHDNEDMLNILKAQQDNKDMLNVLEAQQRAELRELLNKHVVEQRPIIQRITLNRLTTIIDNVAPF